MRKHRLDVVVGPFILHAHPYKIGSKRSIKSHNIIEITTKFIKTGYNFEQVFITLGSSEMTMPTDEIIVRDIAGSLAYLHASPHTHDDALEKLGFIRSGKTLSRAITDEDDRLTVIRGLIDIDAVFSREQLWSAEGVLEHPATIVDRLGDSVGRDFYRLIDSHFVGGARISTSPLIELTILEVSQHEKDVFAITLGNANEKYQLNWKYIAPNSNSWVGLFQWDGATYELGKLRKFDPNEIKQSISEFQMRVMQSNEFLQFLSSQGATDIRNCFLLQTPEGYTAGVVECVSPALVAKTDKAFDDRLVEFLLNQNVRIITSLTAGE